MLIDTSISDGIMPCATSSWEHAMADTVPYARAARADLRPMNIGDILDAAFRLYRQRFATFVTIVLVAYTPYALLMGFVRAMQRTSFLEQMRAEADVNAPLPEINPL